MNPILPFHATLKNLPISLLLLLATALTVDLPVAGSIVGPKKASHVKELPDESGARAGKGEETNQTHVQSQADGAWSALWDSQFEVQKRAIKTLIECQPLDCERVQHDDERLRAVAERLLRGDMMEQGLAVELLGVLDSHWNDAPQMLLELAIADGNRTLISKKAALKLAAVAPKSKEAVMALIEVTKADSAYIHTGAALKLAEIAPDSQKAVRALIDLANRQSRTLEKLPAAPFTGFFNLSGVEALGKVAGHWEEATARIVEFTKHGHPYMRLVAAEALGNVAGDSTEASSALLKLTRDDVDGVRLHAAAALRRNAEFKDDALAVLVKLTRHRDPELALSAAVELRSIDPQSSKAVSTLVKLTRHRDAEVRLSATRALVTSDRHSKEARMALVERTKDKDEYLRWWAVLGLAEIAPDSKELVAALIQLVKREEWTEEVRPAVAKLDKGNPHLDELTTALVNLTRHREPDARTWAAAVLGEIALDSEAVQSALMQLLRDEHINVRKWAAWALGKILPNSKEAVRVLVELTAHRDPWVRLSAAMSLREISPEAKEPSLVLLRLTREGDATLRKYAFEELRTLGPRSLAHVTPLLAGMYDSPNETAEIRFLAYLLGGGDEKVNTLVRWLGNADPIPQEMTTDERKYLLDVYRTAWEAAAQETELRGEIARRIGETVRHGQWDRSHLPILETWQQTLQDGTFEEESLVARAINAIE